MLKIKKFPFDSKLGWSMSRINIFNDCKRKYYYSYYNKYILDTKFKEKVVMLNNLSSIPLEVGIFVHNKIADMLNGEKLILERTSTVKYFEEYYHKVSNDDINLNIINQAEILLNIFKNSIFNKIYNFSAVEKIVEPDGYGETRIFDGDQQMKAYMKVDYLFLDKDNNINIIDWKTGNFDQKHINQMKYYYLWAKNSLDLKFNKVKLFLYYLKTKEVIEVEIPNEIEEQSLIDNIRIDIDDMNKYCASVDYNMPKGITVFPLTENINKCRYCKFKEICGR